MDTDVKVEPVSLMDTAVTAEVKSEALATGSDHSNVQGSQPEASPLNKRKGTESSDAARDSKRVKTQKLPGIQYPVRTHARQLLEFTGFACFPSALQICSQ